MLRFSTYEKAFDELLENEGLKKKAAKSGISYGTLKKVYNRGMAAWRTGHRPGTTPQQWGMARVNSYIGKGKGTYYGADADLSGKGKKKKKESFGEAYDKTNKATMHVKDAGVEREDHPFIRKDVAKTGAKVKFHSGGGISYHGSDHQIAKALKQHHPDDHKELGNLNYHKSGQHDKDYGSHGSHVYTNHSAKTKKESYESVNEKLDHAALKRDFNEHEKGSGKVHTITKTHTIKNAHIMGKHSFDTKKGKVPVLKRYDRKQFTRGPVTVKKGTHVVIDKDESYAHGYHPDAGHFRFIHHSDPDIKNDHDKYHKPGVHKIKEATVKEISKGLAKRYVGKAARDVYFKGRSQATKDAISQLGGPDTDYKKSPERKAAMRMRGIDRATKRLANATIVDPRDLRGRPKKADPNPESKYGIKHPLHPANVKKAKKEATTTDAERKAMADFIARGKMKKLPPGKAAGYHGKSDPGSSMKGMISPADTKQFGTKKKVGSMK